MARFPIHLVAAFPQGDADGMFPICAHPVAAPQLYAITDVFVIKLGRLGAFIRRPERFLVPVIDDIDSVRIQRRNEQDDGVVQNPPDINVAARRQTVRDEH